MRGLFALSLLAVLTLLAAAPPRPEPRWWKGNTHTHTLWSDGDAPPDTAADWYKSHGYHFLVLSDHNIQLSGEKWVKVGPGKSEVAPEFLPKDAEFREKDGVKELRLRTIEELRTRFEGPEFRFIQGEEITDSIGPKKAPLHHNSLNHTHLFKPVGGESIREAMQATVAAVEAEAKRSGREMLVHLNHPNFHWAVTPDDIANVPGERFFEIYNGHRGVRNYGDAVHPGLEAAWDYVNTLRLSKLGGDLLYGLATDDAHNYRKDGATANPGRGWIWVRAESLEPDTVVRAMKAGDFYASSGVRLEDVVRGPGSLTVKVASVEGVRYVTRFIGTRAKQEIVGELLQRTEGTSAVYRFKGDELYVRAVVISDRRHPNGYDPDDFESAWIQPVTTATR